MPTVQETLTRIESEAKSKAVQEIREIKSMKIGAVARQGDIYVHRVPDNHEHGAKMASLEAAATAATAAIPAPPNLPPIADILEDQRSNPQAEPRVPRPSVARVCGASGGHGDARWSFPMCRVRSGEDCSPNAPAPPQPFLGSTRMEGQAATPATRDIRSPPPAQGR